VLTSALKIMLTIVVVVEMTLDLDPSPPIEMVLVRKQEGQHCFDYLKARRVMIE
jgi:hypothetical protein